jgi:Ca-activated chloride channel family protein
MNNRLTLTFSFSLILFAGIILGWVHPAHAQGLIIDPNQIEPWVPPPPVGPYPVEPITLQSESFQIELDDQFAHIRTTQIFANNTGIDLEGTYVFPLPSGADISDFSLWLDGVELTAETLPAGQASQIYQQIVATMRDPGLLEYMGDGLIQAHIYPIPAYGTKQVDLEYDWFIPIDNNLMRVELPLKLDGYSIDRINSLTITVEIDSPDALGTIYSPTHDVRIDRSGARNATVSLEKSQHRPQGDFVLYISRPDSPVGLNMLTHSTGDNEGYFLAMVAPEYDESRITVVPKDFACVLDVSGSMAGEKIVQAKEALDYIFRNLNSDDRFQLITFATDVYPYYDGWSDATSGNIADVRDYIDGIDAGGSTNIYAALEQALSFQPDRNRPMYVIFLTDGLPTVGETNTAVIIDHTNSVNSDVNARIFCFGVGDDVDYDFIDRLSRENGGYTANVAPNEDLEQPLSDFYSKIKSPVMTNLEIEFSGSRIYDMLPVDLPDLFLGSQLILTGRYVGTGSGNVVLTGMVGNESQRFTYPVQFTNERKNDFIPRQWATRRVGYLLNQIRLYGENQELVDEVTDLARRYGIITPYTSMLVVEDEMMPAPINDWAFRSSVGGGGLGAGAPMAREQSEALSEMEEGGYEVPSEIQEAVKYAGDKTFYLDEDGVYVDSEYTEDEYGEPTHIVYLSDEYFDLVDEEPDIAEYLAVGDSMIIVWNDMAYQIDPE